MSCDVSFGDYDGESAVCYSETFVKRARKEHRCYECSAVIPPGSNYTSVFGVWDGEGTTYKFCDACWELMHEFTDGNAVCFGVLWGNFGEAWSEGASISSCINRVSSVAAKSKLLTRWRKYKGLEF